MGDDLLTRAEALVGELGIGLRQLMALALGDQRYSELAAIAVLADEIAAISDRLRMSSSGLALRPVITDERQVSGSGESGDEVAIVNSKRPRPTYPRFEREGERLIKVGWSKKDKSSYEHRVSMEVASSVFAEILRRSKKDKPFRMDELIPATDSAGVEIPSYQVYLVVAWLRDAGAVAKYGNDGYSMRRDSPRPPIFEEMWLMTASRD